MSDKIDRAAMRVHWEGLARAFGIATPEATGARISRAWDELLGGYDVDPDTLLATQFADDSISKYDQAICLRGIGFVSVCEHHFLPFEGSAHVAYIPSTGRVVGLSKLARLVDAYARRLQLQERLTGEVSHKLMEATQALGVAVVIEAKHGCLRCRGAKQEHAEMVTSSLLGVFRTSPSARAEVMQLLLKTGGSR